MALPEDLIRKMVAEALGTFILVLAGTGAAVVGGNYAFAFGFALIAVVYAIGHVSGAHVNPAVTLGLAAVGRFPMPQVPWYIGSQVAGALVASLFLRLVYGNQGGLGGTSVADAISVLDGFLLELVTSAIFVFVLVAVATDKRVPPAAVGLAIGGTLLMIQILTGAVTGASVNPARSLGPAIASWSFADLWIYLTAPFIGAVIGAVAYEFIRGPEGWAEDRPGPEQNVQAGDQRRARPGQQRRAAPAADEDEPNVRPSAPATQRRPAQRPAYDLELPTPSLYDEDQLPPARPAQRPASQPRSPQDPPRQQRPSQQQRRPPQ